MLSLSDSIDTIPLVGPVYKKLLKKLSIETVRDLLTYIPQKYLDTGSISYISDLNSSEKKTVRVTLDSIRSFRTRSCRFITEGIVHDASGRCHVIWFNQPFLTKTLKIGSTILLNGALNPNRTTLQLYSPTYEVVRNESPTHLGIIVPVYPTTEGISSKWLRSRVKHLLSKHHYLLNDFKNFIPQNILNCYNLISIQTAVKNIHFPENKAILKQARKRFAFEELLRIQISLLKERIKNQKLIAPKIMDFSDEVNSFLENLDFTPTKAQIRVIQEAIRDQKRLYPANRLIQGDVGCGKTLVAVAVSIPIIKSGFQVALMAPTAILAKQHFETIKKLLDSLGINVRLVTGSTDSDQVDHVNRLDFIIGTHALLHRYDTLFKNLGLIIIDEQHRFGVEQRKKLTLDTKLNNTHVPHKITMTATPIPRSIALTLFGDLDISIISEMPRGRIPTKTYLVPDKKRSNAYSWIEKKISRGSQVFWLCPLIEESEKLQTKAVITEYKRLETEKYPGLKIDVLHGRLSEEEKNNKILRMKKGKIDILVSTSVIEVGMDIPNADIIVIEGAERFGLAQLHQLRGRVGRKADQASWCFLFLSENASQEARERLDYFANNSDGLKVARYDLQRRGPGEVYGTKQAGIPDLKVASLTDIKLIKETREAAESMM